MVLTRVKIVTAFVIVILRVYFGGERSLLFQNMLCTLYTDFSVLRSSSRVIGRGVFSPSVLRMNVRRKVCDLTSRNLSCWLARCNHSIQDYDGYLKFFCSFSSELMYFTLVYARWWKYYTFFFIPITILLCSN